MVRTPSDPDPRHRGSAAPLSSLVFRDRRTGETGTIAQRDEDGLFVFTPHGAQHPPEPVLEPGRFARVPEEHGVSAEHRVSEEHRAPEEHRFS